MTCEAFSCTPAEARKQDFALVTGVLDYRTAIAARDAFKMKDRKQAFEVLSENPHLLEMLSKMHRAQSGLPLEVSGERAKQEGMIVARGQRPEEEAEEEG